MRVPFFPRRSTGVPGISFGMRLSRMLLVPALMITSLLAGCREDAPDAAPQGEPGPVAPSAWISSAGNLGNIYLLFAPDGTARFVGGFEFLNPSLWEFDEANGELRLSLAGVTAEIESVLQDAPSRAPGTRYDARTKSLVYSFDETVDSLWLAGHFYHRERR